MKTRIITGCLTGIVVILLIFANISVFDIAYIIASGVVMFELMHAGKNNTPAYAVNIIFTLLYAVFHAYMPEYMGCVLPLYIIAIFTVHILSYKMFPADKLFYSVFTFIYVNMLLSYLADIKHFEQKGSLMLLMFVATVVFSDTFAYFIGVTLGKHKLCPAISPKKTIEGSVGAFIGSILAAIICAFIYNQIDIPVNYIAAIIYGVICGGLSQIGDLVASSVKRFFDIKDFGDVLPGHGGIMDRLDSILFVAPVFYFFLTNFLLNG